MWTTRTRALVIGGTAVVLVGGATAGTIAVANASGSTSTPSATASATPGGTSASPGAKAGKGKHHGLRAAELARLKDLLHAQWTTKDKAGTVVTHDAIRGTITAVSSTSVTVKAADGVAETYAVGGSTKVTLGQGKGVKPTSGSVGDLKSGANVVVIGTGTTSLTADRVLVPAS